MQNPEILLIKMPWRGPCDEDLIAPLSLASLSEVLENLQISHRVFDLAARPQDEQLIFELLKESSLRIAAVGFGSAGYLHSYDFINRLRQLRSDITIVAGGWHPSSIGAAIFDECPAVDISVLGPGELALAEIATGGHSDLDNVLTRENRSETPLKLKHCVSRSWNFPRYKRMDLSAYKLKGTLGVLTSRGCPSQCSFCSSTRVSGLGYVGRDVDDIAAEFEYHLAGGINTFQILDDNMTLMADRAMAIFERIAQMRSKWPQLSITMPNGIRADRCDIELLTAAKNCGVNVLLFGVESANDDMLAAMKKGETVEQIRRAIENAFTAGLGVRLAFLVGMPGETPQHVENSMRFVEDFYARGNVFNDIYINHPIPFPGTDLYQQLTESGELKLSPDEYLNCPAGRYFGVEPIFETAQMSFAQRIELFDRFKHLRQRVCKNPAARQVNLVSRILDSVRPDKFAFRAGRKIYRTAQKICGAAK